MNFKTFKLKHFYFNKYILSKFKTEQYHLSINYKHKALWFRTYKVASRTIDNKLRTNCNENEYLYCSSMSYSPKMFENYFKFAFIRNPETRLISAWKDKVLRQNYFKFEIQKHEKMKDLGHFINWVEKLEIDSCDEHVRSQNSLIDLNNIDFIGRFETFAKDFTFVLKRLNIDNSKIQHHNTTSKKIEFKLTEAQRKKIHTIYKKDYQLFYPHLLNN